MKFSIVIPTHNRPALLAVAVKYAMQSDHPEFEVIVSDNSSTDSLKALNAEAVRQYVDLPNFKLVSPPRHLSPPEHFEFALDFATGDYIAYLTDKMVLLPHALSAVDAMIGTSGVDIVNWAYAPYYVNDSKNPSGAGLLVEELEYFNGQPKLYEPLAALRFKSSCIIRRDQQLSRDYALGKIIFGCYSRDLVNRIRSKSGTLFGGATHDYSAMVQALSLANKCVMLNAFGVLFISLPLDESIGSLTTVYAQQALNYYKSFTDPEAILSSLLVPGLYASQHNMVAHDYKKFLPIYNYIALFDEANWLAAIEYDLAFVGKIWQDARERKDQLRLFGRYVRLAGLRLTLYRSRLRHRRSALSKRYAESMLARTLSRFTGKTSDAIYQTFESGSLDEAIRHVLCQPRTYRQV